MPEGLVQTQGWARPQSPQSRDCGWSLRICISNESPGDADATGPVTTLGEPPPWGRKSASNDDKLTEQLCGTHGPTWETDLAQALVQHGGPTNTIFLPSDSSGFQASANRRAGQAVCLPVSKNSTIPSPESLGQSIPGEAHTPNAQPRSRKPCCSDSPALIQSQQSLTSMNAKASRPEIYQQPNSERYPHRIPCF